MVRCAVDDDVDIVALKDFSEIFTGFCVGVFLLRSRQTCIIEIANQKHVPKFAGFLSNLSTAVAATDHCDAGAIIGPKLFCVALRGVCFF